MPQRKGITGRGGFRKLQELPVGLEAAMQIACLGGFGI
jgi:hypothetical protein